MNRGLLRILGSRNVVTLTKSYDACANRSCLLWNQLAKQNTMQWSNDSFGYSFHRNASTARTTIHYYPKDGIYTRIAKKFKWLFISKTKIKLSGFCLYESVTMTVNYNEWFQYCNLPDTFASWFMITELHVWLLMVRCAAEGKIEDGGVTDGRLMRNSVVNAMWSDVNQKIDKFETENKSKARKQVEILSEQFQAAVLGYDEGLNADPEKDISPDIVLASAIWRRLFERNLDDATKLETIVRFVRKQLLLLDKMQSKDLMYKPNLDLQVKWMSVKDGIPPQYS